MRQRNKKNRNNGSCWTCGQLNKNCLDNFEVDTFRAPLVRLWPADTSTLNWKNGNGTKPKYIVKKRKWRRANNSRGPHTKCFFFFFRWSPYFSQNNSQSLFEQTRTPPYGLFSAGREKSTGRRASWRPVTGAGERPEENVVGKRRNDSSFSSDGKKKRRDNLRIRSREICPSGGR